MDGSEERHRDAPAGRLLHHVVKLWVGVGVAGMFRGTH